MLDTVLIVFAVFIAKMIFFPHFGVSLFLSHGRRYQDWYQRHPEGGKFNEEICLEIESLEDLILSLRRGEGDIFCSLASVDQQIAACQARIAVLERELIGKPYSLSV